MKSEELKLFENLEFGKIRTMTEEGEQYFLGSDIAKILGYSNTNRAITDHCYDRIKRTVEVPTSNGKGKRKVESFFITEGDIYRLCFKSKMPKARQFEKWVVKTVLPSIRGEGYYINDKITPEQLLRLKETINKRDTIETLFIDVEPSKIEELYETTLRLTKSPKKLTRAVIKGLQQKEDSIEKYKMLYELQIKLTKESQERIKQKNKRIKAQKVEIEQLCLFPAPPKEDEYSVINYHVFTFNKQYEYTKYGTMRTSIYNDWIKEFPVEELPSVEGINFDEPVTMYIKFTHKDMFDSSNLLKSIIDRACKHWGVDDKNVEGAWSTADHCKKFDDGKIYICIKQGKAL